MPPSSSPEEFHLPKFSLKGVQCCQGRQDKIQLDLLGWRVNVGNREKAVRFLDKMGGPPSLYVDGKITRMREAFLGLHSAVFNRFSSSRFDKPPIALKIRKTLLEMEDGSSKTPPLVAGRSVWKFVEGSQPHLTCHLAISINPTRFMRHVPSAYIRARPRRSGLEAQRMFATETGEQEHYGEWSTDEKDNWLPGLESIQRNADTKWDVVLCNYLRAIVQLFEYDLDRAQVATGCHWAPNRPYLYQLKSVESYWDLQHDDPFRLVESLREPMNEFSPRFESRSYPKKEGMVSVLKAQVAKGAQLKVYAKTNRRVRLEVTHKLAGNERFGFDRPMKDGARKTTSGKFGCHGWDEAVTCIGQLQEHAAGAVNEFLAHVGERRALKISSYSPYDMLYAFHEALWPDSKRWKTIFDELIQDGQISPPIGNSPDLRKALERLRKKGILTRKRKNVFIPHKDYAHAFRILRGYGARSLLRPKPRPRPRDPDAI